MVFEPGTGILWWRSFFPLFLLKSAEAATLMAVICIISEMQQEEKAGFGQTEALRCGWASCSEGEPPPMRMPVRDPREGEAGSVGEQVL